MPLMLAGGLWTVRKQRSSLPIRGSPRSAEARKRHRKQEGGGQNAPLQACRIRGGVECQELPELLLGRSTAASLMAKVVAHRR